MSESLKIEPSRKLDPDKKDTVIITKNIITGELQEDISDERIPEWMARYTMIIDPRELPSALTHTRALALWAMEAKVKTHPTISLMVAITTASALVGGRVFTSTNAPTSLYTVTIVPTGGGKDPMMSIPSLLTPSTINRGSFSSVTAYNDALKENSSFTTVVDEYGDALGKRLNDTSGHQHQLMQCEKEIYSRGADSYTTMRFSSRSGGVGTSEPETIFQPCQGIAGVTTKDQFMSRVTKSMLADGFINRFIIVDGSHLKSILLDNPSFKPSPQILNHITDVEHSILGDKNIVIPMSDEARIFYRIEIGDCDLPNTDISNYTGDDAIKINVSMRWRENSLRLATALAAYEMFDEVPKWLLEWAYEFVKLSGKSFIKLFEDKDTETDFSITCDKVERWFDGHNGEWLPKSYINRNATAISKMKGRQRDEILVGLLEQSRLEFKEDGTQYYRKVGKSVASR